MGQTLANVSPTAVQHLGGTESSTYDQLDRLTRVSYADGGTQSYTYDAVGNRLSKVEGAASTSYTYDAADRLTAAGSMTYGWDAAGRLTSATAGGTTTSSCWDALDRLTGVADQGSCPVAPLRVNAGGGAYTDPQGQPWVPDTGASGGLTATTSAPIAGTEDDPLYQSERYGSAFSYAFAVPNGSYTVTLKFAENTFSAAGRRVFDVTIEGQLVLDDFDIYVAAGGKNVAVDRAFEVTVTDGQLSIGFSRVVDNAKVDAIAVVPSGAVAPPTSFTDRGDGLRASKTVGGTTTSDTWDGQAGRPVVLQDGTFSYVSGLGLISQTDASGNQTSFLADGLGSTRALTDGSGNVVATSDDDVFGAVRASNGPASSDFRCTGPPLDPSTSLYYLRARSDDPAVGRFLSRDPFPGLATLPASQHAYAYAHHNPTTFSDPTGAVRPGVAIIVLAGGGLIVTTTDVALLVGGTLLLSTAVRSVQLQRSVDQATLAAADLVSGCFEQVRDFIGSIVFHRREQGMLDQIARDRSLTKDQRQELGRAVERYKTENGIPNDRKLDRRTIEDIADEEGLDNRP